MTVVAGGQAGAWTPGNEMRIKGAQLASWRRNLTAMHRLLVALLMILSFATSAVATQAHGGGMASVAQASASMPHASRHSAAHAEPEACPENQACGAGDGLCYLACWGMVTWLAPDQPGNSIRPVAAIWALPQPPAPDGLGPGRNERPPNEGLAEIEWLRIRVAI